jgi:predicted nucleic acid-binding protein
VIEPLKPEDFTKALILINDFKLDFEDSIHLVVATRIRAKDIISNDKDFNTTLLKRNF